MTQAKIIKAPKESTYNIGQIVTILRPAFGGSYWVRFNGTNKECVWRKKWLQEIVVETK